MHSSQAWPSRTSLILGWPSSPVTRMSRMKYDSGGPGVVANTITERRCTTKGNRDSLNTLGSRSKAASS
jgi:hypothetical protein